jgi:hypothetical protein
VKNKNTSMLWDEEKGIATYTIKHKGAVIQGFATCHEEDSDMKNKMTGFTLAEMRCTIKYLKHIKNNELKPQLIAYKHFLSLLKQDKNYDENSYSVVLLLKQINRIEEEITIFNNEISEITKMLDDYLEQKKILYTQLKRAKKIKHIIKNFKNNEE